MNGRDVEALLSGYLLVTENNDVPGIVGHVGTILAKHKLNIANMSLSRNSVGGVALNISTLDSKPGEDTVADLLQNKEIKSVHLIDLVK